MSAAVAELDVAGPAAPPRSNGELVFAEPWEGRAFGLAMALTGAGVFPYAKFRDQLIAEIARWEAENPGGEGYSYYRCWLQALERVLRERSLVEPAAVAERAAVLVARPAGHDHDHNGHGHGEHDH